MAKRARQEDFLKAIAGVAAEVRRKIETECPGFDTSPEASTRRKKRALGDFGFFCQTYFPHYVKGQPSSFHEFLWRRLPEIVASNRGERELIAAPRGNAKSTYVTLLFVLWCLLTKRKRFPVILADTFEQAAVHLASLKAEVEVNPRLAADWPDEVGAGPVWQATEVVLKNGGKVKVGGSGKALRGMRHGAQRPDLVICDDLENDENVKNPDQRKKLESWLDKAVEPLGPPDGSMDLIWVNTFLHYDAVALRKSRNPLWRSTIFKAIIREPDRADLWQRWEEVLRNEGEPAADAFYAANEAALLAGSEVLWPSVQPLIKLWKIKVRVGAASFSSEYQNEPIDEEGQLFGNITFWVERRREWRSQCHPRRRHRPRDRHPGCGRGRYPAPGARQDNRGHHPTAPGIPLPALGYRGGAVPGVLPDRVGQGFGPARSSGAGGADPQQHRQSAEDRRRPAPCDQWPDPPSPQPGRLDRAAAVLPPTSS